MQNILKIMPLLLLVVTTACSTPAPKREQVIGEWQVMVSGQGTAKMLCYAGASPLNSSGTLTKRDGRPYLMATRRLSGKIEISVSSGYTYMPASKVELAVDEDTYSLFHKGANGWTHSDSDDAKIVESMKTADTIEVRGVSAEGLTSIDTYPPHGFATAIARIRELCP